MDETSEKTDAAEAEAPEAPEAGHEAGFHTLKLCVNFRAGDMLPSCGARGAKALHAALTEKMPERVPDMKLVTVHCLGRCHLGPTLRLSPKGPFLLGARAVDADFILEKLAAGDIEALTDAFPDPVSDARK